MLPLIFLRAAHVGGAFCGAGASCWSWMHLAKLSLILSLFQILIWWVFVSNCQRVVKVTDDIVRLLVSTGVRINVCWDRLSEIICKRRDTMLVHHFVYAFFTHLVELHGTIDIRIVVLTFLLPFQLDPLLCLGGTPSNYTVALSIILRTSLLRRWIFNHRWTNSGSKE